METPEINAQPLLQNLASRYPAEEGFAVKRYQAREARRVLEASPDGMKVIAVDYALDPVDA
jgi:hypothetical protein